MGETEQTGIAGKRLQAHAEREESGKNYLEHFHRAEVDVLNGEVAYG